MKKHYGNEETERIGGIASPNRPALEIDVREFEHFLENSGWSEEQKEKYLQTLWNIICEFVLLGFGVQSVQQVIQEFCGQDAELSTETDLNAGTALESRDRNHSAMDFAAVSAPLTRQAEKGKAHADI